jgi:N-acyl-D-amino-acid deacylase
MIAPRQTDVPASTNSFDTGRKAMHDLVIKGERSSTAPARRPERPTSPWTGARSRVWALRRRAGDRTIDADGLLVTPGWVDIHTHYDGQATWDEVLAPSSWHGVTTIVTGNCGVGFAPARPDRHDWLIGLMEGVEDIPGTALAEGIEWDGRPSPSTSTP